MRLLRITNKHTLMQISTPTCAQTELCSVFSGWVVNCATCWCLWTMTATVEFPKVYVQNEIVVRKQKSLHFCLFLCNFIQNVLLLVQPLPEPLGNTSCHPSSNDYSYCNLINNHRDTFRYNECYNTQPITSYVSVILIYAPHTWPSNCQQSLCLLYGMTYSQMYFLRLRHTSSYHFPCATTERATQLSLFVPVGCFLERSQLK